MFSGKSISVAFLIFRYISAFASKLNQPGIRNIGLPGLISINKLPRRPGKSTFVYQEDQKQLLDKSLDVDLFSAKKLVEEEADNVSDDAAAAGKRAGHLT